MDGRRIPVSLVAPGLVFVAFLAAGAEASVPAPLYPETRVWGFGLTAETRIEGEQPVSVGATWACGSDSGRKASGSGEFRIFDPNGNALSTSAYGWTRLFQGREFIPMLDAYDFRARTLWPELGRFGQEDSAGPEMLTGPVNIWRVRVGDYRIVYTIEDDVVLVLVLRVGHRREIYRLVLPMLELTADEDHEC